MTFTTKLLQPQGMSIIKRSCTTLALLAVVLSIVNAFSVTTTYTSSECTSGSEVSRSTTTFDCPTDDTDIVYDKCTKGEIDGSYYVYNSSYCNSTSAPELLEGFYIVYSWNTVTNCTTEYEVRLEVKIEGETVAIVAMSTFFFQGTMLFQCNTSDTLSLSQCRPDFGCFNESIPHATCVDVGSSIYQTTCYEHRNAPVSVPQSMTPSDANYPSVSQPMSAPQTNTSGSSKTTLAFAMIIAALSSAMLS